MTHFAHSAAYIRKNAGGQLRGTDPRNHSSALEQELWDLLRTPNTVESLCRAVSPALRASTDDLEVSVEEVVRRWVDHDLVELSPDS